MAFTFLFLCPRRSVDRLESRLTEDEQRFEAIIAPPESKSTARFYTFYRTWTGTGPGPGEEGGANSANRTAKQKLMRHLSERPVAKSG
jgi:hypothetical protein